MKVDPKTSKPILDEKERKRISEENKKAEKGGK